jgi:hypothetical protein
MRDVGAKLLAIHATRLEQAKEANELLEIDNGEEEA